MNLEKLISSFTEYEKKKILEIIIFSTNVVKDTELPVSEKKDTLSDFLKNDNIALSIRLRNILRKIASLEKIYPKINSKSIQDITKDDFLQFRNFGTHCWLEFEQAVSKYKPKPDIEKPNILLEDWLKDFQRNGSRQMSIRLYNQLSLISQWQRNSIQYDRQYEEIYLHEIEEQYCRRMRNFGKKTWDEFVELRGY